MKKERITRLIATLMVIFMLLTVFVSCEELQGIQGEQGLQGEQGIPGKDGVDGADGKDGVDGKDGADGVTPTVEISEDGYWVINGVKTEHKAIGTDGTNGADGKDGADGTDSKDGIDGKDGVGISDVALSGGNLVITLTNGTVIDLGSIRGSDGSDGIDGVGIKSIAFNSDKEFIFTLSDGSEINCGRIPVCDHVYSESSVISSADCTSMGVSVSVCSVCRSEKYEFTSAKGHSYSTTVTSPTCNQQGYTTYTCGDCGYTYRDTYVSVCEHTWGEWSVIISTCTERLMMRSCSVCDRSDLVSEAYDGHILTTHPAKAPGCEEAGWDEYVTCSRCTYSTYSEIGCTGHTEVEHSGQEPTCTENGWETYVTCSACDYTTYSPIKATGHHIVIEPATAPTETEYGLTRGEHCYYCDYVIVGRELIPPIGYDLQESCSDCYGYNYLGTMENGESMQTLYNRIDLAVEDFHNAYIDLSDTVVANVEYASLGLSSDEALAVYATYKNDNPLYWWISTKVSCTVENITILTDEEYLSAEVRKEYNSLIYSEVKKYVSAVSPDRSAYDIALIFHDLIIENISYAYGDDGRTPSDESWAHSILGVFSNESGVCEAYARTFQLLLNYYDIDNVIVTGEANGENHAWNLVQMDDGEWYWYDLTWDDTPHWMWGISYNYMCVNDMENLNWCDGGWVSSGTVSFTDKHIVATPDVSLGGYFLYELPSRSSSVYSSDSLIFRDQFIVDGFEYIIVGGDTVQVTKIPDGDVIIPSTVTYNDITYRVISLGSLLRGFLDSGTICSDGTTSVFIPESIRFIWDHALQGYDLTEITVDEENPYFTSLNGVLFTKSLYTLIQYPLASERTEYVIPEDTVYVAAQAFYCYESIKLETLTIGKKVLFFGKNNWGYGYYNNSYSGLRVDIAGTQLGDLANILRSMAENAIILVNEDNPYYYSDGVGLYDKDVTYLYTLVDKSITVYNMPDSLTKIEAGVDFNKLRSIVVTENNAYFASYDGILYNKDMTEILCVPQCIEGSITIPDSVTSIGSCAFYYCRNLTSITIPNSVTSIGDSAFADCDSLTSITIPNSVTSIGDSAFNRCDSLTSITIPNNVTSIGSHAFCGCSSLRSITIPDSVTSIGGGAFSSCTSLVSITIPDSVTSIGDFAFYSCDSLASVTIGNGVTSIGNYAFEDCTSLEYNEYDNAYYLGNDSNPYLVLVKAKNTSITSCMINENTKVICGGAFSSCTNLTSITIPDSVTSIGGLAFYNCTSLTSVTIGNSVTSIGEGAFYNCDSLTSVTIGNSVTSIGGLAFYNCTSLTSVTIPNSVTCIGCEAFYNCISLTSVTIGNSVTSIGDYAFYKCTSLKSITIPDSVTSIGAWAFGWCESLTSITFEGTVEQWNAISLGSSWKYKVPATKVICSDGTVTL